jgi:hypothetical protein
MRISKVMLIACITILAGCKSNKKTPEQAPPSDSVENASNSEAEISPPPTPEPPQSLESDLWTHMNPDDLPDLERAINPPKYQVWQCSYTTLLEKLSSEQVQVMLPTENGLQLFNLENSGVMAPELAAKFPEIKSYKGSSTDRATSARVDTNEKGLFAEFKNGSDIILIAPYLKGSKTIYTVYNKEDLPKIPRDENFEK